MERVFNPGDIKAVVGLGNPGSEYRDTYHNAGFLAIDRLAAGNAGTKWREGKNFAYAKTDGLILAKPAVFMNESGRSVRDILKYFKIKPKNLLLVHDDSDLKVGDYKIGFGRGAAGHHGVISVMEFLATPDFWRMRIGTRNRPGKAGGFALKKISPKDEKNLEEVFETLKRKIKGSD
jgi:PTH1 family peptidyl-tRNA hydrolase